jgi:hypothetical protein
MSEPATLLVTSSESSDPPAALYRAFVYRAVPRLLGALDRDAQSLTVGSFDRDHWAWKFRDHPVNMLQTGLIPLAHLYSLPASGNPYWRSPRLLAWMQAGINETLKRQHANGSYDTVTPYSQDHGVSLLMVYTLTAVHRAMGEDLPADVRRRLADGVRRACRFAARSEEDYAFISNHHALFALAWQRAGVLLDDATLQARGRACADAIIDKQSPEGWYTEYDGPDPGYESLGISYLARYVTETAYEPIAESLRRSVEFLAHLVHPDGSVGGAYASRCTQLWYPSGCELLAATDPLAARVADFMRDRLLIGNVVTPDTVDIHNLPSLLNGYLDAASACDGRHPDLNRGVEPPPRLPFESWPLLRRFDDSGITVASTQHYFAVTNGERGGAMSVFDRASATVAYEDSGIVVSTDTGTWSSAAPARVESRNVDTDPQTVRHFIWMGRTKNAPATTLKFLILRTLSLTVFRSIRLGKWVRRMIIAQLITGREEGPFTTERSIHFGPETIAVEDQVTRAGDAVVRKAMVTRGFQPFHMGSARYFHPRDLVPCSVVESGDGERSLNATGRWSRRVVMGWTARGDFAVHEDGASAPSSVDL